MESGNFSRARKDRIRTRRRQLKQSNFVDDDPDEEVVVNCQRVPIGANKFFSHLHLKHGGESKVVKAQIDSASTCNTMPSSVLSQLFPKVKQPLCVKEQKNCTQLTSWW